MTPDDLDFFADKSGSVHNNARMNSPTTGLRVASVVFAIVCLGHLLRLITHAVVIIGTYHVPIWPSVLALIVSGLLCIWMWRLSNLRGIA
jgi:Flp pilus assembly protein TadB